MAQAQTRCKAGGDGGKVEMMTNSTAKTQNCLPQQQVGNRETMATIQMKMVRKSANVSFLLLSKPFPHRRPEYMALFPLESVSKRRVLRLDIFMESYAPYLLVYCGAPIKGP